MRTHADLCSGVGGFSLGLEAAGFKTIAFAEIDEYASAILRKHWPFVPNFGDVREVPTMRCHTVTAGFPCQPHSLAGKRKGQADDRYIWPEIKQCLARIKPAWIVLENVPGIIGVELDAVLSDVESLGYELRTFIVPAVGVDARHRRDRVWIVANSSEQLWTFNGRQASEHRRSGEAMANSTQERCGEAGRLRRDEFEEWSAGCGQDASDSSSERPFPGTHTGIHSSQKGTGSRNVEPERCCDVPDTRRQRPEESEGERLVEPEEPRTWPVEPELGRVAHGIPSRVDRIRCLGNSIVPQIAHQIGKTITAVENLMKKNLLLTLILTPFLAFGLPVTKPIPLTFGSHGKTDEADFLVPFLIGTPLGGAIVVDFTFAPGQFARLTQGTPFDFQAFLWLQTDVSGFPGFVVGTGYLTGDLGQPLHTPQRLGTSDADNGSMACGLFPLFSGELTAPVAFRGVHLDLVLPSELGQVTEAEFRLLRGPFFVGPVPEHIHPLLAMIIVMALLITFRTLHENHR